MPGLPQFDRLTFRTHTMSNYQDFQLPEGVTIPECFTRTLSYQIWFYEGVQVALEGQTPLDHAKLSRWRGEGNAEAYRAGFLIGQKIVAERSDAGGLSETLLHKSNLTKKDWFVKGLCDAVMGRPPLNDSILRTRRGDEAANEYWDGYESVTGLTPGP